ncbi:MAG: hypothetical protein ACXAC5_04285 [Promethearchaeota archaeon]
MYAKFYPSGKINIYNKQDELVVSGIPGAKSGDEEYHPMMDYAVALMKLKGDWPDDPLKEQTIQLAD